MSFLHVLETERLSPDFWGKNAPIVFIYGLHVLFTMLTELTVFKRKNSTIFPCGAFL